MPDKKIPTTQTKEIKIITQTPKSQVKNGVPTMEKPPVRPVKGK